MLKKFLKYICLPALLAVPIVGFADDDDDARFVSEQLRDGVILPLSEILAGVRDITGGNILEIEVEHEDHGLVYEVYFLDSEGIRREIYIDAMTGEVLVQKIIDRSNENITD